MRRFVILCLISLYSLVPEYVLGKSEIIVSYNEGFLGEKVSSASDREVRRVISKAIQTFYMVYKNTVIESDCCDFDKQTMLLDKYQQKTDPLITIEVSDIELSDSPTFSLAFRVHCEEAKSGDGDFFDFAALSFEKVKLTKDNNMPSSQRKALHALVLKTLIIFYDQSLEQTVPCLQPKSSKPIYKEFLKLSNWKLDECQENLEYHFTKVKSSIE